MKKHILVLAGAALILASCGGENKKEDQGQTQAQIDSAVNAQVAEREAEMARKNDSTLKAMEAEKAAAEAAAAEAAAKKHSGTKKSTTKTEPVASPTTPPPAPVNTKDSRFAPGTTTQKKVDEVNTSKKADRFGK